MNVCNADVHEAADLVRVSEDAQRYGRLVGGRSAPDVYKEPGIRDLNVPRRALDIPPAQNATAEDRFVEAKRSVDIGDGEKMRDGEPVSGGHLIVLLFDVCAVHGRLQFRGGARRAGGRASVAARFLMRASAARSVPGRPRDGLELEETGCASTTRRSSPSSSVRARPAWVATSLD